MKKILKNLIIIFVLLIFIQSSFTLQIKAQNNYNSTDIDTLSFKQEISIPIDTSLDIAKFQPIDFRVEFSNPCWAKDTYNHSIRVVYQIKAEFKELESQIYALNYSSENIITT